MTSYADARDLPVSPPMSDPFSPIRRRLARRPRRVIEPAAMRPAAVLIALFESDGALHVLFTLRTETVRTHKGQVSFPGGARHDNDRDLLETALRESREEIGLHHRHVEILGPLDDVLAITSYQVTPWVARIDWPVPLMESADETQEIFSVPLPTLLDPAHCELEERLVGGTRFYPLPRFTGGKHVVWGLTGHILASFLEIAFDWAHPDLDPARISTPWWR